MQHRSRLVGQYLDLLAGFPGCSDDAQRRPVAAGRQRTGVAVGEDRVLLADDRISMASDRSIHRNVFIQNGLCLNDQLSFDLEDRLVPQRFEPSRHPTNRPEQIHRRGARRRQMLRDLQHALVKGLIIHGLQGLGAERYAHRRGNSNGRSAANPQLFDGDAHGLEVPTVHELHSIRQEALVQNPDHAVLPFNRRKHCFPPASRL